MVPGVGFQMVRPLHREQPYMRLAFRMQGVMCWFYVRDRVNIQMSVF